MRLRADHTQGRDLPSAREWATLSLVDTLVTSSPTEAAAIIKRGGIVAFPTETVYGLGADIFNENAVRNVFQAKGRPGDNPLIAHIHDLGQLEMLTDELGPAAQTLLKAFAPGPMTVVVKRSRAVPLIATAGLDTIGIRLPRLTIAREFLSACGVPVVAPSANLSGRPSPTTWEAVMEDLGGRIDGVLVGPPTEIGLESTVVDCSTAKPVILRSGAITMEEIRKVLPEIQINDGSEPHIARSPGMKHRHYSPSADVRLAADTDPVERSAYIGLKPPAGKFDITRVCLNVDEYARSLYEFFRECDRRAIKVIYCEPVPSVGLGVALMDRIRRAAEGGASR